MAEAREFSISKSYAKNDLVMYNGVLFEFTSAHSAGAWTGSDVSNVDSNTEQDLTRILAGRDNAIRAAEYVATLPFIDEEYTPEQITGTRYKFTFSDMKDPR